MDGVPVDERNVRQWQKQIGYVPQEIVLTDTSIAENIAFGVSRSALDMDCVRRAAKSAGILDFIESSLPQGFETKVGDRGVRLSGGQRQRIGIARALYNQPRVVVFDEATSSLDSKTEETVLAALRDLAHKMTIVLVAHRVHTLEPCDVIFRLEAGRIVNQGGYDILFSAEHRGGELPVCST